MMDIEIVKEIKRAVASGERTIDIARRYGLPKHAVNDIKHGNAYVYIDIDTNVDMIKFSCEHCGAAMLPPRRRYCSRDCNSRAWHLAHLEDQRAKIRANRLMKEYGITVEQYNKMYEAQKGLCKICEKARKLDIDHDHKTGEVRGLICRRCNTAIGYIESAIPNMYRYLVKSWRDGDLVTWD